MSDAPERIWATGNEDRGVWTKENTINALSKFGLQNEEYTRSGLIQPMIDKAVAEALERAVDACTYVIQNIEILKADGETYQPMWVQKVARGLVDVARQDIRALIPKKGDTHDPL